MTNCAPRQGEGSLGVVDHSGDNETLVRELVRGDHSVVVLVVVCARSGELLLEDLSLPKTRQDWEDPETTEVVLVA